MAAELLISAYLQKTAIYGYFGRQKEIFTLEKTDKAEVLRKDRNEKG